MKKTSVALLLVTSALMSACGGGGDGGGDEGGVTPVVNTAPTLSVSKSTITLDENSSTTFTYSASDKEDSSLELVVTSDNTAVSFSKNGNTVTVSAGEVDSDVTVRLVSMVTDSGGLSNSKQTMVTVKNVVPVVVNTAPVLTSGVASVSALEGTSMSFAFESFDAEDGDLSGVVEYSTPNPDLITISKLNKTILLTFSDVDIDFNSSLTLSVSDSGGLSQRLNIPVTILNTVDENNEAPSISLSGADENNSLVFYELATNTIPVVMSDPDSSDLSWVVKSFDGVNNSDAVLDYIESLEVTENSLVIKTKQIPVYTVIDFKLVLTVNDGNKSTDEEFTLSLTNVLNSQPLFSISNRIGGYAVVPVGTSRTFSYSIMDDDPSNVLATSLELWYGDDTLFSYSLNAQAQTITINNHSLALGDNFGLLMIYEDGTTVGTAAFTFTSSKALGATELETLDFVQDIYSKLEAVKEYQYVAEFYSEVAENLNLITSKEARDFNQRIRISDNNDFNILKTLVGTLESVVVWGSTSDSQDPVWIADYKGAINSEYELARANYGKTTYSVVNEIANATDGLLPTLSYNEEIFNYDSVNNSYSRFAGNGLYGVYEGSKFVFSDSYSFFEAVVTKAKASERKAYAE